MRKPDELRGSRPAAGRKRLAEEKRNWKRVTIAVNRVLTEES